MNETSIPPTDDLPWLPMRLRRPSASGAKDNVKFAFFAEKRRLLVQRHEELSLYDCGDHVISAISAPGSEVGSLTFTSQRGELSISELRRVS